MTNTAKIGLIGLGVMGQNLSLNIERNGFPVAVYDREPEVLDAFVARQTGKQILGAHTPEEFVEIARKAAQDNSFGQSWTAGGLDH